MCSCACACKLTTVVFATGLAYVGSMCEVKNGKSSSIVQDLGDFQSAGVVAHELGHR